MMKFEYVCKVKKYGKFKELPRECIAIHKNNIYLKDDECISTLVDSIISPTLFVKSQRAYSENLLCVRLENDRWYYIDDEYNVVIRLSEDVEWAGDFHFGLALVQTKNHEWHYIDKNGYFVETLPASWSVLKVSDFGVTSDNKALLKAFGTPVFIDRNECGNFIYHKIEDSNYNFNRPTYKDNIKVCCYGIYPECHIVDLITVPNAYQLHIEKEQVINNIKQALEHAEDKNYVYGLESGPCKYSNVIYDIIKGTFADADEIIFGYKVSTANDSIVDYDEQNKENFQKVLKLK